ncbi:hypothetical protein A7K91_20170 [Paenibacillus oryzae]|uniref:Fibronectin type-III domain-containing protein n=1 Tax=Paenibacillus oryzae TaxID=1844972 RepID=A0A1A5YES2_9BACL|nr:hypothetical protein A7K91_20170 [Paenibacillus oryzae]
MYNGSASPNSNGTPPYSNKGEVSFKFVGTKFRIIAVGGSNRASNVDIYVDGAKNSFALNNTSTINNWKTLAYEVTGLDNGVHEVVMNNFVPSTTSFTPFGLDAIDIDEAGYLINANIASPSLFAQASEAKVDLNWTSVTNATGYNVKRALTSGGPYETIATSVPGTTYSDAGVIPGITYYYVVTAINVGGEGAPSNVASATIPIPEAARAILIVTMTTGLEKEYDLSMQEVNDFINWYEAKQEGTGKASYAINKHDNIKGPFKSRKDYILFDRILTFEVSEY